MKFTLNKKIIIDRTTIFLCGPYFTGKSDDRRKILQMLLHGDYQENVLPLIIDDFLSDENLNPKMNVQLLEEIFAAFSFRTYIFLDTISAASELGLFGNNTFSHGIKVFLPKVSDIHDKSNVGYFVRNVILGHDEERIEKVYYRPKITRHPIASDFVKERYGFINDKVPNVIKESIKEDKIDESIRELLLEINESSVIPNDVNKINYQIIENELVLKVSVKLLFYITVSLVYSKYRHDLSKRTKVYFSEPETAEITEAISFTLTTFIKENVHRSFDGVEITTIHSKVNKPIENVVEHMVEFIGVYHSVSTRYRGYNLIKNENSILGNYNEHALQPGFMELFDISTLDNNIINEALTDKEKYYETSILRKGNKKREIVKYVDSTDGMNLRNLHAKIVDKLLVDYDFSNASFAYRKGTSTIDCVRKHEESCSFVKLDIRSFFNSIDIEKLIDRLVSLYDIRKGIGAEDRKIIQSCFYKGKLPLGLVASPMLSDIYLRDFDDVVIESLKKLNPNLVFTRYADDMLISMNTRITDEYKKNIIAIISNELKMYNLELNDEKTRDYTLENVGDHFRFLGINIVKSCNGNTLTVGKKYIYDTAKMFLIYLENAKKNNANYSKFYHEKIISGRISYITHIEGKRGFQILINRIQKSTDEEFKYSENKLVFE